MFKVDLAIWKIVKDDVDGVVEQKECVVQNRIVEFGASQNSKDETVEAKTFAVLVHCIFDFN